MLEHNYRTDHLYIACKHYSNNRMLTFNVMPILKDDDGNEYVFKAIKEYHNYMHHCYRNVAERCIYSVIKKEAAKWQFSYDNLTDHSKRIDFIYHDKTAFYYIYDHDTFTDEFYVTYYSNSTFNGYSMVTKKDNSVFKIKKEMLPTVIHVINSNDLIKIEDAVIPIRSDIDYI